MNTKLVISNLSVAFEEKQNVLSNINLEIYDSEIGSCLGQQCGKTTLLRAIAGFENIHSGSIIKDGTCISNNLENTAVSSRNMGMVFQDYALFPNMNVNSNIEFGLKNLSNKEKNERVITLI